MFHPIGLPRYHLCAAKPPKNNHNSITTVWRSVAATPGEVSSVASSSYSVTPSTGATAVLCTGNPA